MNNITKVSEITYSDLADYLRISEVTEDVQNTLNNLLNISIAYITGYTGLTTSELDNYPDMIAAVCILVQDMYDTRALYVDITNLNFVVKGILDMHSTNLLPEADND